jgi:ribosomal protein S18 acetylase RimI-like enzyme
MIVKDALVPGDLPVVRSLFREYQEGLGISLCFQGFEAELDGLPGAYAPPAGCLLLAWDGSTPIGCVAVRPIGPGVCELKRLYARPAHRGTGLGRALAVAAIARSAAAGHRAMRLDSLATMVEARGLYRSLGFTEIAPYNDHPVAGTIFMELELIT